MRNLLISAMILVPWSSGFAETNWEKYLSYPSPENAMQVSEIKYSPETRGHGMGYWATDIDILRNQVLARDSAAFQLATRLLNNSDGGLLEEVYAVLASSIRPDPNFFLSETKKSGLTDDQLKFLLRYPGLEYVDRPNAQDYEISMRQRAISSVAEPGLADLRKKCLEFISN